MSLLNLLIGVLLAYTLIGGGFLANADTKTSELCRIYRESFLKSVDPRTNEVDRDKHDQVQRAIKKIFVDKKQDLFEQCEDQWYSKAGGK